MLPNMRIPAPLLHLLSDLVSPFDTWSFKRIVNWTPFRILSWVPVAIVALLVLAAGSSLLATS